MTTMFPKAEALKALQFAGLRAIGCGCKLSPSYATNPLVHNHECPVRTWPPELLDLAAAHVTATLPDNWRDNDKYAELVASGKVSA